MNARLPLVVLAVAAPFLGACTVATNHPDEYDATTEANVLDGYVRQALPDPGDEPLIVSDDGEVVIPDDLPAEAEAALDEARCVYAGITDEEDGIRFDDWDRLDGALADDAEAVVESAEDTEGEVTDVDRAFLRLEEIQADCARPG